MSDEVSSKHGCAFFELEGYARLYFRKELGGGRAAHNCNSWWVGRHDGWAQQYNLIQDGEDER
jgi:hypothetical protein